MRVSKHEDTCCGGVIVTDEKKQVLFLFSLSSTITLGPLLLHFGSCTIFFTRRLPPNRTSVAPAPVQLSHNFFHTSIASWSDQYHVASSLETRPQKPCPCN